MLSKFRCFNFYLSYFEVQVHIVPHLKALSGVHESRELKFGIAINICQANLKIANLLHKQGFVDFQLLRTVSITNNGIDCESEVGFSLDRDGKPHGQALNIGGCSNMGQVLHELMHTIGLCDED